MPPKASQSKPRTRRNPLGKVEANAVQKSTPKSSTKSPKNAASKASPKTQTKASTSTPEKAAAKSSPKIQTKTTKSSTRNAPNKASDSTQTKPAKLSRKSTKTIGKAPSKSQSKAEPVNPNANRYQDAPKYLLLCRLRDTTYPSITRLLSVPSSLKFAQLHDVLQIAFGWANCHHHKFSVTEAPPDVDEDGQAGKRMFFYGKTLLSLSRLPDLDEETLGQILKDAEFKGTSEVSLEEVFENEKYDNGKTEVLYEYDMGDGWEHDIVFLGREAPGVRRLMGIPSFCPVICLNGEGHPCAEDVGGIPGWEHLKGLFAKPRSRDQDGTKGWYKNGGCANGDPKGLDPYRWNILEVNFELSELIRNSGPI